MIKAVINLAATIALALACLNGYADENKAQKNPVGKWTLEIDNTDVCQDALKLLNAIPGDKNPGNTFPFNPAFPSFKPVPMEPIADITPYLPLLEDYFTKIKKRFVHQKEGLTFEDAKKEYIDSFLKRQSNGEIVIYRARLPIGPNHSEKEALGLASLAKYHDLPAISEWVVPSEKNIAATDYSQLRGYPIYWNSSLWMAEWNLTYGGHEHIEDPKSSLVGFGLFWIGFADYLYHGNANDGFVEGTACQYGLKRPSIKNKEGK